MLVVLPGCARVAREVRVRDVLWVEEGSLRILAVEPRRLVFDAESLALQRLSATMALVAGGDNEVEEQIHAQPVGCRTRIHPELQLTLIHNAPKRLTEFMLAWLASNQRLRR